MFFMCFFGHLHVFFGEMSIYIFCLFFDWVFWHRIAWAICIFWSQSIDRDWLLWGDLIFWGLANVLILFFFFFPRLLKLLCRQLHYVWIVKFSFFLSIWYVFYFCLLPVALNKTCWYWKWLVRVDILALFPVLEIKYSVYVIKYNISYRFFVDTFYQVEEVLL